MSEDLSFLSVDPATDFAPPSDRQDKFNEASDFVGVAVTVVGPFAQDLLPEHDLFWTGFRYFQARLHAAAAQIVASVQQSALALSSTIS